jgi:hyaluronoglucosaminidase
MLKGYIEGYYGRLFSQEERSLLLRHMGKLKMDFYLYGPKEDPYHRVLWEKPYPSKYEKVLEDFVKQSKKKQDSSRLRNFTRFRRKQIYCPLS